MSVVRVQQCKNTTRRSSRTAGAATSNSYCCQLSPSFPCLSLLLHTPRHPFHSPLSVIARSLFIAPSHQSPPVSPSHLTSALSFLFRSESDCAMSAVSCSARRLLAAGRTAVVPSTARQLHTQQPLHAATGAGAGHAAAGAAGSDHHHHEEHVSHRNILSYTHTQARTQHRQHTHSAAGGRSTHAVARSPARSLTQSLTHSCLLCNILHRFSLP